LPDPYARRCYACGQALYRKPPRVLGEENRIGANLLPIDRWMLDRLQPERKRSILGRNKYTPPVAWHGRFATSARTPELEPAVGGETHAIAARVEPDVPTYQVAQSVDYDDTPQQPATVGALALDVFVQPMHAPEPMPAPPVAEPVLDEPPADTVFAPPTYVAPSPAPVFESPAEPQGFLAPPPVPAPAPQSRPVVSHEELEPDVRALVDELYLQARAELSGSDAVFGAPSAPFVNDTPALDADPVTAPVLEEPAPDVAASEPETPSRRGWVPAAFFDEQNP
jgi:hypothetical protein